MGRFSCTLFAARFSLVFVWMKHQSIVLANGVERKASSGIQKSPAGWSWRGFR